MKVFEAFKSLMEELKENGIVTSAPKAGECLIEFDPKLIEIMEENYYNSKILKRIDEYSEVMDLV